MTNWTREEALQDVENNYTKPDHPLAFAEPNRIVSYYNGALSRKDAENIVHSNNTYTIFRENRSKPRKNIYNGIFVRSKRQLVELDLCDVSKLSEWNSQIRYWLVGIDSLTRYLFLKTLKTKSAIEVLNAFKEMHKEMTKKHVLKSICVDRGSEFLNLHFKQYLAKHRIILKNSKALNHCPTVERSLRTLQQMLYRYLAHNGSMYYLDVLPDLVKQFNARKHSTTNLSPEKAESMEGSEILLIDSFEKKYMRKKQGQIKYPVGTLIRFTMLKSPFHRGYSAINTDEVFKIIAIDKRFPKVPLYEISSLDGEKLIGKWYNHEISKVNFDTKFSIKKIVKRRRDRCLVEYNSLPNIREWLNYETVIEAGDQAIFQPLLKYSST